MSRSRSRAAADALLALTAAATTWFALVAWRGLTHTPGDFLNPLLLLAAAVAGTGALARWGRWPRAGVVAAQAVAALVLVSLMLSGSPLPLGGAWSELARSLGDAVDSAQGYAAPVPDTAPPVDPLLIVGGVACLLLVDLLAVTLRRVPLAGVPLLAILCIPVGVIGDVAWWIFAVTVAGFLTLLALHQVEQVTRWGRPLGAERGSGDPISFNGGASTVRGTAGLVGGTATALAVLVPALIPTAGLHVFDIGPGNGGGDDITISNPTTDLVRDLKRGKDVDLVRVTTTDPDPSYLRILTLTRFTEREWSPGDRDVSDDHLANGSLPPPQGVSTEVRRRTFPYDVEVLAGLKSSWLPTQPPLSAINADGDWRYDERTMDFLSGDDGLSAAGMRYSMTGVRLDVTSADLAEASTARAKVDDRFTELPDDLPPLVHDLSVQVTGQASSPYEKAVALQRWFREDGGFTYSLDRAPGSGADTLVDFLTDGPGGRIGYCEQFASAMAVMARELGIPARVAVGFLDPTRVDRDTWVYSAHDMHAWPELFFDGAGWVRFEPTPASRAEDVPAYTIPGSGERDEPSQAPSASATTAAPLPQNKPRERDEIAADAGRDDDSGGGIAWGPTLGGLAGVVLIGAVLLVPRGLRARRRDRRLGAGDPEATWAELRDTATDLGTGWPLGRSPRATYDLVVDLLGAPVDDASPGRPARGAAHAPAAAAALARIVHALELARYSRADGGADPVRLRADAEACIAALGNGATGRARRRAAWWPRSVLRPPSRQRPAAGGAASPSVGVVDRVTP